MAGTVGGSPPPEYPGVVPPPNGSPIQILQKNSNQAKLNNNKQPNSSAGSSSVSSGSK